MNAVGLTGARRSKARPMDAEMKCHIAKRLVNQRIAKFISALFDEKDKGEFVSKQKIQFLELMARDLGVLHSNLYETEEELLDWVLGDEFEAFF